MKDIIPLLFLCGCIEMGCVKVNGVLVAWHGFGGVLLVVFERRRREGGRLSWEVGG